MQLYNEIHRDDAEIEALAKRIKPVVDGHYIRPVNLFSVAYTWSPEKTEQACDLVPFAEITTYHKYGYHGFFKPSIGEVICCIPEEHLDSTAAFEIVEQPETAEDLNEHLPELHAGFHVAKVRLYKKAA